MPAATQRSRSPRRVRCPTCKSRLAEPATANPVYRCPVCSTLLQAKQASGSRTLRNDPCRNHESTPEVHLQTNVRSGYVTSIEVQEAGTSTSSGGESSSFSFSNSSLCGKTSGRRLDADDEDDTSSSAVSVDEHSHSRTRINQPVVSQSLMPSTQRQTFHSLSFSIYANKWENGHGTEDGQGSSQLFSGGCDGSEAELQSEDGSLLTNHSEGQPSEEHPGDGGCAGNASEEQLRSSQPHLEIKLGVLPSSVEGSSQDSKRGETIARECEADQSLQGRDVSCRSIARLPWHSREARAADWDATKAQEQARSNPSHNGENQVARDEAREQQSKLADHSRNESSSVVSESGSHPNDGSTSDGEVHREGAARETDIYAPPLRATQSNHPLEGTSELDMDIYPPPLRNQNYRHDSAFDDPLRDAQLHRADRRILHGAGSRHEPSAQFRNCDSWGLRIGEDRTFDYGRRNHNQDGNLRDLSHSSSAIDHHQPGAFEPIERKMKRGKHQFVLGSKVANEDPSNGYGAQEPGRRRAASPVSQGVRAFHAPSVPAATAASMPPLMLDHPVNCYPHHSVHPFCAFCASQSYLQPHPFHAPALQAHCAICSAQPVCLMAHKHHLAPRHGHMPPLWHSRAVGRHRMDKAVESDASEHRVAKFWGTRNRKRIPPFPMHSAAPYVVCQHCNQLLQVPDCLPPTSGTTRKLRCSSCLKVSKFSIRHFEKAHARYQTLAEAASSTTGDPVQSSAATRKLQSSIETDGLLHQRQIVKSRLPYATEVAAFKMPTKESLNRTDPNAGVPQNANHESISSSTVGMDDTKKYPPVVGCGFGSDLPLQGTGDAGGQLLSSSAEAPENFCVESGDFPPPLPDAVPGSPLHEHFGYRSPGELLRTSHSATSDDSYSSGISNGRMAKHSFGPGSSPPLETFTHKYDEYKPDEESHRVNDGSPAMHMMRDVDDSLYPRIVTFAKGNSKEPEQQRERSVKGFLKRSLRDIAEKGSQISGSSRQRVIVNGEKVSKEAIKRAEERAGKLRPGSYWYDCKAGFWGVFGGPCLGILPPFIEGLNGKMARDCSNGRTQILVNGRELHYKDLEVLAARRGFPTKPGKAYSLHFDGIIIDEETGLELKSLRKLAPTVSRKGKGYGMCSTAESDQIYLSRHPP